VLVMGLPVSYDELRYGGAYILGLRRHEWRRARAAEKLVGAGWRGLIAAEGVDGHERPADLDAVSAAEFPGLRWAGHLSAGHRGCSLGHMRLWKYVVDAGLQWAVIFEDDVLPHPRLAELGPIWWAETVEFERASGLGLDMVLLGNQMNVAWIETVQEKVVASPAYCLHAYVLTQSGARKLMTKIEQLTYSGAAMPMNDILVYSMLAAGELHYCCWNRGPTERGVPVFSLEMPLAYVKENDVAIWHRDTGLFSQNGRGGSTLHDFKPSYMFGTSDSVGDEEIKAYLKREGEAL
jgi:GR25 family glycosyltransferase involved in LPS biosynthesis